MKKFVIATVLCKAVLLSAIIVFTFVSCRTTPITQINQPAAAQATPVPKSDETKLDRPTSEPYTGDLSIFEDPNRDQNLQISRVMDILKITEGKTVADVGAGSGWFSVRAAKKVGAKGKVYAVEINREYLDYIKARAAKENYPNIETVLGTESDPKLPAGQIDAVLILKTYHEIADPITVLENIRKSLKPNGLIGIIDKNGNGDDHGLNKEKVIAEAARAGFALKDQYDFTKADGMDYFLVFRAEKM